LAGINCFSANWNKDGNNFRWVQIAGRAENDDPTGIGFALLAKFAAYRQVGGKMDLSHDVSPLFRVKVATTFTFRE
jgi:hypothetical protein